ncbi:MAG: hypothetical protein ACYTFW_13745 [Planctomycetota bacterium]|jgi:hypothetical protein
MKKTIGRHSNRRQQSHPKKPDDNRADLRKRRTAVLVSVGVAAVVVISLVLWVINTSGDSPSAAGQAVSAPQTAAIPSNFQTLVGQWVRMDTPYVIEIQSASQDGTLQAKYYNPRSINISVAEARDKDGTLEVFVELRDVNYPGSTYTLTYDRARELLVGVYFQAAMQQKYDVVFRRLQAER